MTKARVAIEEKGKSEERRMDSGAGGEGQGGEGQGGN